MLGAGVATDSTAAVAVMTSRLVFGIDRERRFLFSDLSTAVDEHP
jgi:hypothetical protein